METQSEKTNLILNGSKVSPIERPKNENLSCRKRPVDASDDVHNLHLSHELLSKRATLYPTIAPPNSPLVLQMYNHKKTRESLIGRVRKQMEHARKRRLHLKKASLIESHPDRGRNHAQNKQIISHSHDTSPTTNSYKTLPRLNLNKNNSLVSRKNPESDNVQIDKALRGKLRGKLTLPSSKLLQKQEQGYESDEDDDDDDKPIKVDEKDNDDDNDDCKSYDSIVIQSIFHNNCDDNKTTRNVAWNNGNFSKLPPLHHQSYSGYVCKSDRTIMLTRKCVPTTYPYQKTNVVNGKHQSRLSYHWGSMDSGSLLNQQISSLCINGNSP